MTEKRFTYIKNSSISQYQSIPIQKISKGKPFHCQGLVDELNKLWNENEQLKIRFNEERERALKFGRNIDTLTIENEQLKTQLNYIQNLITEHIEHQKTELGQKALKEIIEDYNEWLLGHKELILND